MLHALCRRAARRQGHPQAQTALSVQRWGVMPRSVTKRNSSRAKHYLRCCSTLQLVASGVYGAHVPSVVQSAPVAQNRWRRGEIEIAFTRYPPPMRSFALGFPVLSEALRVCWYRGFGSPPGHGAVRVGPYGISSTCVCDRSLAMRATQCSLEAAEKQWGRHVADTCRRTGPRAPCHQAFGARWNPRAVRVGFLSTSWDLRQQTPSWEGHGQTWTNTRAFLRILGAARSARCRVFV